ncbi:GntR family transcriptional regulator [Micromonospora craniellae]|uniref:GntR family transcriptional regulator n=1 Tax=Micromonospora craniellae TaxID=2294034 RepID=UPI001CC5B574|nr:GntR family transcriptional regulator [Micromonospora craniellae]
MRRFDFTYARPADRLTGAPVREALLRLEAEGLVRLYPKRGALILPVSAREIADVVEARRLRAAHAAGDLTGLMAADRAFHATVAAHIDTSERVFLGPR